MKTINIEKAVKIQEEIRVRGGEMKLPKGWQSDLDNYHKIKSKVNDVIKNVEGRASARTITADDVFTAINYLEEKLNIPKKYMIGIKAAIDVNAQHFPSAYKYDPMSTIFEVERKSSGWVLTEEAKKQIINNYRWF